MRGVEAAFAAWYEVEKGRFASEALRQILTEVAPAERRLAASLLYGALRRQSLWKDLIRNRCRRPFHQLAPVTRAALILGTAGLVELRHFVPAVLMNALAMRLRAEKAQGDEPLLHAVLHRVTEDAPRKMEQLRNSAELRDQALLFGVPGWAAAHWSREWGTSETRRLLRLSAMKAYLSLRVDPTRRDELVEALQTAGTRAWASPDLASAVRTASFGFPPGLPGYEEGAVTPMSESSLWVGEAAVSSWSGGAVLDLCAGRGVKTGHLATRLPEATLEAWDLSAGRVHAGAREMARLGVADRVTFREGDALELEPRTPPSLILADVPCSGSGTWSRHPEAKWRLAAEKLEDYAALQVRLLERAADLVLPGGRVVYSTCSLFREENEKVVAELLGRRKDLVEVPFPFKNSLFRKGRPYGTVIWPGLPWVDGFYAAVLMKRR